jgi:hypothetical protein
VKINLTRNYMFTRFRHQVHRTAPAIVSIREKANGSPLILRASRGAEKPDESTLRQSPISIYRNPSSSVGEQFTMAWWRGHWWWARFGDLRSWELKSVEEGGAGALTWGALAPLWEILSPGRCQRRRARFQRSDGEGSTTSWVGGQNREDDGGSYHGNGTLTLTKSSSIRITDKPNKVGSASGNGTEIMSSNVFPQFKHIPVIGHAHGCPSLGHSCPADITGTSATVHLCTWYLAGVQWTSLKPLIRAGPAKFETLCKTLEWAPLLTKN